MKISVLGTDYEVFYDLESENADGETNLISKEIHVRPTSRLLDADCTDEEREAWARHVMRHEIVHAWFKESGLHDYCYDETLVDWIAYQWPKMTKAFEAMGCDEG